MFIPRYKERNASDKKVFSLQTKILKNLKELSKRS